MIIVPEVIDEGDKSDIRSVTLDDGAGLFRIKKRGVERGFEVKTSNIIAGVKGTLFAVLHRKTQGFSRVAVYSGVVEVTDISKNPDTATELGKGKTMDVEGDTGFGDTDGFEPGDAWDQWQKEPNPSTEFLGRTAPVAGSVYRLVPDEDDDEDDGEDDDYDYDCPPVVDNDGNTIIP